MCREHFEEVESTLEEVSFYSENGILDNRDTESLSLASAQGDSRYEYLGITSTTFFEKKY